MLYLKFFRREQYLNRYSFRTYLEYGEFNRKKSKLNRLRYAWDSSIGDYVENPKSIQFVSLRFKDVVK